jgi:hypothetical protein
MVKRRGGCPKSVTPGEQCDACSTSSCHCEPFFDNPSAGPGQAGHGSRKAPGRSNLLPSAVIASPSSTILRQAPLGMPGTGGTWLKKGCGAKQSPPFRCHCEPCKGEAISSLACDVTLENPEQSDQPEDRFPIGSQ